jgi:hypothetical protein
MRGSNATRINRAPRRSRVEDLLHWERGRAEARVTSSRRTFPGGHPSAHPRCHRSTNTGSPLAALRVGEEHARRAPCGEHGAQAPSAPCAPSAGSSCSTTPSARGCARRWRRRSAKDRTKRLRSARRSSRLPSSTAQVHASLSPSPRVTRAARRAVTCTWRPRGPSSWPSPPTCARPGRKARSERCATRSSPACRSSPRSTTCSAGRPECPARCSMTRGRCSIHRRAPAALPGLPLRLEVEPCRAAFEGRAEAGPVKSPLLARAQDAAEEGYDRALEGAGLTVNGERLEERPPRAARAVREAL